MKRIVYILFFVLGAVDLMAQNSLSTADTTKAAAAHHKDSGLSVFHVNTWIETVGSKDMEKRTIEYALFPTGDKARGAIPGLRRLLEEISNMEDVSPALWKKRCEALKVRFRKTKADGTFSVPAYPGNAVLVCTFNPDNMAKIKGTLFNVLTLQAGKTNYDCVFRLRIDDQHVLDNTMVMGNKKKKKEPNLPPINADSTVLIPIKVDIDSGWANENSRLTIQPFAIDAETGDTVDFVHGLVYEGTKFHKLQERLMRYDYKNNDKVAFAYVNKPLWPGEAVHIDTTLVYRKRDFNANYKSCYEVALADYTHIYWRDTVNAPQNLTDIYKLINYGKDDPSLTSEEKVALIHQFNIFKKGFAQYASGILPSNQIKGVKEAMGYLVALDAVNLAVICTEGRHLLKIPPSENVALISTIPNDNPKKWYLLGIIKADEELENIKKEDKDYIPEYLCFFNHAFELKPSYKWMYFKDGQISDELRAKYKYSKLNIAKYREMFENLYHQYDKQKNTVVVIDGEGEMPLSGD